MGTVKSVSLIADDVKISFRAIVAVYRLLSENKQLDMVRTRCFSLVIGSRALPRMVGCRRFWFQTGTSLPRFGGG